MSDDMWERMTRLLAPQDRDARFPQRCHIGSEAWDALREHAKVPAQPFGYVNQFYGVPIVLDESYPPDIWRILDQHGEEMASGSSRFLLSKADLDARLQDADEHGGGPEYDCWGVGSPDGPCGGCGRCFRMMESHYFEKSRVEAAHYHAAGFEWAPYAIDLGHFPGFGGYHESYGCAMAKERPFGMFPWEKL